MKKPSFLTKINKELFIDFEEFKKINDKKEIIIFDTNFLFVPFEFRVEMFSELQNVAGNSISICILDKTLDELIRVEEKGDKNKKFLPLIATFLNRYSISILTNVSSRNHVDDILCDLPPKYIIATNDKELKQRLWKIPVRVIFMRQKSYLDIK